MTADVANAGDAGSVEPLAPGEREDVDLALGQDAPSNSGTKHLILPAGAVIYACMDWCRAHEIMCAASEARLTHIQTCVWDKGAGAMGSLYQPFAVGASGSGGFRPVL